jgi:DNA-binding MarR family transcriptional regulator
VATLPRKRSKETVAREAWRRVFDFFWMHKDSQMDVLRELGLTPGHMKALLVLELNEPRPMGALAEALHCDASTGTWLVDGLEEKGIVERQALPTDRRVKTVALTPLGEKTKATLLERLYDPPAHLLDLDTTDLDALVDIFGKLPGESPATP